MKIISSAISLTAAHSFYQEDVTTSSLAFWRDDDGQELPSGQAGIGDRASFSREGLIRLWQSTPALPVSGDETALSDDAMAEDPELRAMRLTLELLTGHKLHVASFHPAAQENNTFNIPAQGKAPTTSADQAGERAGWGMEYDYHNSHTEQESLNFSADGFIITADGREINFSHGLRMERLFSVESELHIQAGDERRLVDPLVINFSGQGSRLGDVRFNFDLDGDGLAEEISFVAPDSGFLALDRNGDGRINDGTELFGPASGHGFAELAGFDADANGWLDENDPVFDKLKVWMADQAGQQRLLSLAEVQVGALLLTPLDTEFTLADSTNSPLGQIRQTSLAFFENGAVASIQELDLVV
ncbi:MAG: VCBS repeat-containing protein [Deltaproteobacteria bacterium]|nr:VCBS repeat-containing protein [Deltaproteobacteria bacterium]